MGNKSKHTIHLITKVVTPIPKGFKRSYVRRKDDTICFTNTMSKKNPTSEQIAYYKRNHIPHCIYDDFKDYVDIELYYIDCNERLFQRFDNEYGAIFLSETTCEENIINVINALKVIRLFESFIEYGFGRRSQEFNDSCFDDHYFG